MKNLKFVFALHFIISTLISCKSDYDFSTDKLSTTIQLNSDVAVPLVDASISFDEILTGKDAVKKYLIIGSDKFLTMVYELDYANYPAKNFFGGVYSGTNLPYYNQSTATQSLTLGLDKLQNKGEFYLADPKITISIKNFWNIPTQFKFANLNYYKTPNSLGTPMTGTLINKWIAIKSPVSPAKYGLTDIIMDKTTANLDAVISAMPHHISFNAIYETIPGGTYTIDPTSTDSVKVKVEVPLDLRISKVFLVDTLNVDLSKSTTDTANFKSILLNLIVNNGFPLSIDAQIYFTDNNYKVLDSISNTTISFKAGKTTNGQVTESTETLNTIQVDGKKMANLLKSKHLITRMNINTSTIATETVKLYSNYKLGLKIGALVKLQAKT